MFKIDSEKELLSFLKILSEEAVAKSRSSLSNGDQLSQSFKERLRTEKETLYEQEEDEAEEESPEPVADIPQDDAPAEEAEPESEEPEQTDTTDQSAEAEPEKIQASLDALERFINSVRAGKSLRDSTVEDQLELYFDRLGEDEKSLLVLFMREVSRILSGKISGDAAVNPNDEPYNLDVVLGDEEQEASASELPDQSTDDDQEMPAEELDALEDEEEEDPEDNEDTSPPIKVGGPQSLSEIRKKIKLLMKG